MSSLSLTPAARLSLAEIAGLYNETYSGYSVPFHLDEATTRSMVRLFDLDLERSVVGWLGDRPVAMAMLGLRPGLGWIGGMGVAPEARGRGLGAQVLDELLAHARAQGATLVWCNARPRALSLYERAGFVAVGEPWDDPELGPHQRMELQI